MRQALRIHSLIYSCSFSIGFVIAAATPALSQAFADFLLRYSGAGIWITSFLHPKNTLMIGLSIFFINFFIGAFIRFIVIPMLLYHIAYFLGSSMGFLMGLIVGSPNALRYSTDVSSIGTGLWVLTVLFENLGYVVACAIGYKIGKRSQEGLTRKDFLKLLAFPVHLKDATRRLVIKNSLRSHIGWILLCMLFIIVGAIFETLLIIYFI